MLMMLSYVAVILTGEGPVNFGVPLGIALGAGRVALLDYRLLLAVQAAVTRRHRDLPPD